jgi:excisionase family DNA binding protein
MLYSISMKQQKPYLSTAEAAKLLDVSPQRVRDLIKAGRLEAFKVGRDWAVSRKSVEEFERAKPWELTSKNSSST